MSIMTFRIPDAIRKRMAKVRMNWSEVIRHAISEVLESDAKKNLIQKTMALRSKTHVSRGTAAGIIRRNRDHA